jgi:hypothetical protein
MKLGAPSALLVALALCACQVNVREGETPEPEPDPAAEPQQAGPDTPVSPADPPGTPDPSSKPSTGEMLDKLKGQKVCTQMGCIDGFHVDVEPQVWPKGRYKFTIAADDRNMICEGSLPLPACGKQALACKGDVEVMIAESGCALPPEQHGFGGFTFKGAPAKVSITIARGGKEVAKGTYTPAYKKVQPNGPECQPTCNHASDKLTVK